MGFAFYRLISLLSLLFVACPVVAWGADIHDLGSLRSRYQSMAVGADVARFRLDGCQVLVFLTKKKAIGVVYLIPEREDLKKMEALQDFASRLHAQWCPQKPEPSITIDDRVTYAQLIYTPASDESTLMQGTHCHAALLFNEQFGPPLYWKDGRLHWRYIFNRGSNVCFVVLNPNGNGIESIEMKLQGDKVDRDEVLEALNKGLKLNLRAGKDYREIRTWCEATSSPSNKLLGRDSIDVLRMEKVGRKGKKKNALVPFPYYLVKDGEYLLFASTDAIKAAPKDEATWLSYAPIQFPDISETLEPVKVESPPPVEPKVVAIQEQKAAPEPQVIEPQKEKHLPAPEPVREMSFDEAFEAYLKSLSEEGELNPPEPVQ